MGIKDEILGVEKRLVKPAFGRPPEDHARNTLENIPKNYGNGTGFSQWLPKYLKKQGANLYPATYNPYTHGPYYPSRYYGKADTAFMDVKLGEVPAWIGRRNKSFRSFINIFDRGIWRWTMSYVNVKKPGITPMCMLIAAGQLIFWLNQWGKHRNQAHSKYH